MEARSSVSGTTAPEEPDEEPLGTRRLWKTMIEYHIRVVKLKRKWHCMGVAIRFLKELREAINADIQM